MTPREPTTVCPCPERPTAAIGAPDRWECPTCGETWWMWVDSYYDSDNKVVEKCWYAT